MKRLQLLLKEPFLFTKYQLDQYNIRKSQIEAVDDTQEHFQLRELHNNFINENSFISIGQAITHTMTLIADKQSSDFDQKLNHHQSKSNAKNIFGTLLYSALSNLAIRVSCGATSGEKNKYPITHFHIRCLCCNQTVCMKTIASPNTCDTNDTETIDTSESEHD